MRKEKRGKLIVTEEEIKTMLDLGVHEGTIKKDEKKLVEEIFDFDETEAKIEKWDTFFRTIFGRCGTLTSYRRLHVG